MSTPAAMLDAIVARLAARLQPADATAPRVRAQAVDDTETVDLSAYQTVQTPGVYVTCIGLPAVPLDGTSESFVEASFVARCYARLPAGPGSRGDVAMNLAALVSRIVEQELWLDASTEEPTASQRATRITARNRGSRALAERGLSLWLVSWQQQLEVTDPDLSAILHSLRGIDATFVRGGDDTPDDSFSLDLEGGTPP